MRAVPVRTACWPMTPTLAGRAAGGAAVPSQAALLCACKRVCALRAACFGDTATMLLMNVAAPPARAKNRVVGGMGAGGDADEAAALSALRPTRRG